MGHFRQRLASLRVRAGVVAVGALSAALTATAVYAAVQIVSPSENGVIEACYDTAGKGAGKLRLINPGDACRKGESLLRWKDLTNFNNVVGSECAFQDSAGNTRQGAIELAYDTNGFADLRCGLPSPECGDLIVNGTEECDDGNQTGGDGCSSSCTLEEGSGDCGNGQIDSSEECDDSGTADGDGCSSSCAVESGYACSGAPSVCAPI